MFSLDGTTSGRPAYSLPFDTRFGAGRGEALWLTEDDFDRRAWGLSVHVLFHQTDK